MPINRTAAIAILRNILAFLFYTHPTGLIVAMPLQQYVAESASPMLPLNVLPLKHTPLPLT
jgi:hypothetical protein